MTTLAPPASPPASPPAQRGGLRHWRTARRVLICGGILHLLVGVLAAMVVDAQQVAPAPLSVLFDAVPAVAALVAAFLIAPAPGERRR